MNKLAKRNKIKVIGTSLLYFSLCLITILLSLMLFMIIFIINQVILIGFICCAILLIACITYFIKNFKELYKILKLLNSKPEYYLEIYGDSIKVNALDKEYTIKFSDIERLNYSYDRPLICANFLLMYGNHKYKLNTHSEKSKSNYIMFDLSKEYIKVLKKDKKTKHGILLITTKDYFFVLPEIENVENCFNKLKELIGYTPQQKENEKNEYQDFLGKIYLNIMQTKKKQNLDYNEEKFISLANMIEGTSFDIEKNIQYLEELEAINYANLLKDAKIELDNLKDNNKIVNTEDFVVHLFNKIRLLDEQEPFYKLYLVPFAETHLQKYIK